MRSETRRLAHNTVLLYILAFSSQLLSIVTIPYQTRVVGPSWFGVVGMTVSVMGFVAIALDFGFLLSATRRVAEERDDRSALCGILTTVSVAKGILSICIGVVLAAVVLLVDSFREHAALFSLYFFAYAVNAFLPDYLYRGMENMRTITIRTVGVRVFFTVLVFVFLRTPEDVLVLPVLLLLGNALAVLFSFVDLRRRYGLWFQCSSISDVGATMRESLPFFVSRSAATAYQSLNAVLLGAMYPGQPSVGYFSAADKILNVAKSASSPVADSLFPYMVKHRNYRLCLKILVASVPLLLAIGVGAFVFAGELCAFLFGEAYYGTGVLLRCLLPALMVIFPTYIICFPVLVPMGLSKQANRSTLVGAGVQLVLLVLLFASGHFSAASLCVAASISEVSVFLYRLGVMVIHRDLMEVPQRS